MPEATLADVTDNSFDYIIVGGGTAGLTLAALLSSNPSLSVLVLEAGESNLNDPKILILGQLGLTFGDPKYAWAYQTVPQKYSGGRRLYWNRGKGLGGSSALNFTNWTLPSSTDIDAIENLGNPGWNWKEFERYAHRIEKFQEPQPSQVEKFLLTFNKESHGHTGTIKTAFPAGISSTIDVSFLKSFETIGVPFMDGYGGNPVGVHVCPVTMDLNTHMRSYAANEFYVPNKDRANLTVLTTSHVTKVLFDSNTSSAEDLVATGVEFIYASNPSTRHVVHAKKEVILSAGTIIDPQLLELSGIGRREVLESIGVDVKVELPGVGENLQDHQITDLIYELPDDVDHETWDRMKNPEFAAEQRKLQLTGEGLHCWANSAMAMLPFATLSPANTDEFVKNAEVNIKTQVTSSGNLAGLNDQLELQLQLLKDPKVPDTEMICLPGPGYYSLSGPPKPDKQHFTIFIFSQHPFSRGTVHCTTNDPLQPPAIDPNNFANESDLELMLEEIKFVRKLVEVEPFKSIVKKELDPGPERQSDEDIREYIRLTQGSAWHACGTCSMLPREKNGVVDPNLKVYGTRNLRIADLSIIPLEPGGHTQSIAYIVGMKAADIILAAQERN